MPEVRRGLLIISSRAKHQMQLLGGAAAPAGETGKPAGDKAASGVDRCIPTAIDGGAHHSLWRRRKRIYPALARVGMLVNGDGERLAPGVVICSTTRDYPRRREPPLAAEAK